MKRSVILMAIMLAAGTALTGCQTAAPVSEGPTGYSGPPRDSAELAYSLAQQTWCSNDEAASLVLLLLDGADRHDSFEARMADLAERQVVNPAWSLRADDPVTKGTLGYMVCRALDIDGGVLLRLTGLRRYAYREALHEGLMQRGSEFEPLTGPEVVGVMGRAARR